MNTPIQIFVTCFLGAFIGGTVSLKVYPVFWWVGALVGALVAYFSYNIKEVVQAVPIAYRHAVNWRPNKVYWAYWRKGFVFHFNIVMIASVIIMMFMSSIIISEYKTSTSDLAYFTTLAIFCLVTFPTAAIGAGLIFADISVPKEVNEKSPPCPTCPNVFRFFLWIVPSKVWWFIKRVPQWVFKAVIDVVTGIAKGLKTFVVKLFVLIHSECRLLVSIYAALGVIICYFEGNALIGAIAGGLFGLLNYEIITVRVLKLARCSSLFK